MKRGGPMLALIVVVFAVVAVYQTRKPLPVGVSVTGTEFRVPAASIKFLADKTYVDADEMRHSDQEIFDEVLAMIDGAQQYILVDMFLYNEFQGDPPETTRELARELTEALADKKKANPAISITLISDPLNTVYGGVISPQFARLREAGVKVVLTDLIKLRDSNPLYSAVWRTVIQWFGNKVIDDGFVPNPFTADGSSVTVRSWLALLNFKANHRKLIVADEPQFGGGTKLITLVTSANPHDGSSAHSNVALRVDDKLWQEVVASEQAVGEFSGVNVVAFNEPVADSDGEVTVQLLTEGAIRRELVKLIDATKKDDTIDIAMFYISERSIVRALKRAAKRGADIRLLLDANKDAFGRTKNGVPNRPVASELIGDTDGAIKVRWCRTHGEQCHSKMVLFKIGERQVMVIGSANLTQRNIDDYNLETNILVAATGEVAAITDAREYFEDGWDNRKGQTFSTSYEVFSEDSLLKTVMYRIQEATGLSSF